ncbi:MAG TPA: glycoside hydrolase family 6 protein [Streptosporangiaceae bacterium]|nr:glycoside hydrolase family 6 protein [Streptosporangiaceae bacterium]
MNLRKLRRHIASVAALLIGMAGLGTVALATPASAATGCTVAYVIQTDWGAGFVTNLNVTNLGSPITSWTLTFSFTGNQTVTNGWNGNWSQSGKTVTVTNASYNGSLATGGSAQPGAQFAYSGTNLNPATFTLNGVQCTVQTSSAGSIVVSPTAQNITQGHTGTVGISLSAAPTSNVTVSTAFTSGNSGESVTAGSSLTFTPSNFATPQTVTITADSSGTGAATFTASASGYPSVTFTATEMAANSGTPTINVSPTTQTITQGGTGTVGISLSSAPTSNVTVTTALASGNNGLSVSAGSSLTFTPSNFGTAQNVTITANSSGTGMATFNVSASGLTTVTFSATEAAACTSNCGHVADPFTGAKPYLNPDYVKEAQAQATADGSAAEASVASFQTAIWLDSMAAINGGGTTGRTGLMQQLTNAAAQGTASTPSLVEIVVYDLPGRDCAALASNGEIPATTAGLTEYETQYIDPIASILKQFASSNIRVVAIIEPDSLPNVVTNQSLSACQTASPFYEQGITYALNQLHAISNVYNYMDIAHSAWLGWPNNMNGTPAVYNTVVKGTTAGYASIDGFISDTANYTPTQEPLLTNPTLQINGTQIDSVTFYQFNPTFDEQTYDTAMYNTLVSAGFPASKRFLIDTSRNGWGPTHPTTITQASDATTYVNDNKIDKRPFRGDWCNQNNSGIGARPTDEPFGTSSPIEAFVWIKPPGESDGDYPTSTHSHGDPHCDPNGTNTDGNGNTYPTGAIPGFDVPAGQFFPAEFQMLVSNAFPSF